MGGQNSLDFSVGNRNWLDFNIGLGIKLVFEWVVEIDLILCAGQKSLGFSVGIEISLVLCA